MHIYIFGSLCRGDVVQDSDVDLLALTSGYDPRFNYETFSIYSYERLKELWAEGNPFAWHLHKESRLVFSSDAVDFISLLGEPNRYQRCEEDCRKFFSVFCRARECLVEGSSNVTFELSNLFLAIRNIATCYSLGVGNKPCFSRRSALEIGPRSLCIPDDAFSVLERARILCTRGSGNKLLEGEVNRVRMQLDLVMGWMNGLLSEVSKNA
jgi:Nucleotidyltransferase domain